MAVPLYMYNAMRVCRLLVLWFHLATSQSNNSLPSSLCTGCRMRNGKGYNIDPDHCFNFVQCHFNQGGFGVGVRMPCTPGQFWDQEVATCKWAWAVQCPNDECLSGIPGYPVVGNCRTYWYCEGNRTQDIACCSPGYRYSPENGCVVDASCTDDCPPVHHTDDTCHYTADSSDPRKFKYTEHTGVRLCCPRGLGFDEGTCGCTRALKVPVTGRRCSPSVHIDFKHRIYDSSLDKIYVQNYEQGVTVRPVGTASDGWVGQFAGTPSRLIMPRFSNTPFGSEFKIFIRFKEEPAVYRGAEVLISNADCGKLPTIQLTMDRQTKLLTFSVTVWSQVYSVSVTYVDRAWKDVVILYESNTIWMSADNRDDHSNVLHEQQESINVFGDVDVSACALNLGWGDRDVPYRGIIDAVAENCCKYRGMSAVGRHCDHRPRQFRFYLCVS